jgi:ribonuclease HI
MKTPRDERLDTFLTAQGVAAHEWDLVLCGDGSGGGWSVGGGFAVFLVDKVMPVRDFLTGGYSKTTVNRMELGAYTQALSYHYYGLARGRLDHTPYKVWVFTDSEITAKVGAGIYTKRANIDLWHMVDWFESRGYRINWRHIKRNSTAFHHEADGVAGRVRKAILAEDLKPSELAKLMPYTEDAAQALVLCEGCKTPLQKEITVCPICRQERTPDDV